MQPDTCIAFCFGPAAWGPAALAGVVAGIASALFVRAYVRLAGIGAHPDLHLCLLALRVAYCRPLSRLGRARAAHRGIACCLRGPLRQGPVWILAVCFGMLCAHYGLSGRFVGLALACTLLVNLAWIDLRSELLPDALTYPLLWLGIAASWAGMGVSLHLAIGGVVAGYVFLYLCAAALRLVTGRDVVGGGDIKLLAGLGAWLGAGWLAWVLMAACLAGVVCAMWHQRTWRPRGDYPFGPFLALAALCVFCLAPLISAAA